MSLNVYDPNTKKLKIIAGSQTAVATDLDGLSDIHISSPSNGQVLTYDNTEHVWKNAEGGGGGAGGGHTIEDSEGTELTQRDIMQFGVGFLAEDDDTNEKTVISPDVMQSGDMSDIITPLPSVQPRYQKYSTEEQVVGEWIDGRTLYQKTIQFINQNSTEFTVSVGLTTIGAFFACDGYLQMGVRTLRQPVPYIFGKEDWISYRYDNSTGNIVVKKGSAGAWYNPEETTTVYVTIQYTKTTDTPNT